LLDRELGDVQEAPEVRRDERFEVLVGVVRERLGEEDAGIVDRLKWLSVSAVIIGCHEQFL
jgi:hypothetical protein